MKEDLGRLAGVGMIRPAACRCRLMEATDTLSWWWCSRCQAMVCGPLSRPLLASVSRSPMIRSMVVCGRRAGLVCGRRERGSNAASPSARYRVTSRDIQLWETPYSRATSDWLRPSTMTAVMTKRAFDTRRRWPTHLFRCLATPHSDVLKHHTVSLLPGRIATPRARQINEAAAARSGIPVADVEQSSTGETPAGRYGERDGFGAVAAFLCSAPASYMTGAALRCDGGLVPTL